MKRIAFFWLAFCLTLRISAGGEIFLLEVEHDQWKDHPVLTRGVEGIERVETLASTSEGDVYLVEATDEGLKTSDLRALPGVVSVVPDFVIEQEPAQGTSSLMGEPRVQARSLGGGIELQGLPRDSPFQEWHHQQIHTREAWDTFGVGGN